MVDQPITLTDRLRSLTGVWMTRVGVWLHGWGLHPDVITLMGFGVVCLGAFVIGTGRLQLGAAVLLCGLPFDALDGAVARAMQRKNRFGGVLDSTLDRYADAIIFAGLGYYFAVRGEFTYLLLTYIALMGSFVVSYVRARAGEAGLSVKVGLFDRFVRLTVILTALFLPVLLIPALWILAVGTNITGLQRLWYVYRLTSKD